LADKGSLNIKSESRAGTVIISPDGEVGYHEAPVLRAALREALDRKPPKLVANLAGISYMATPGLATLVEALQISKKTQVPLVLCGLTDRVRAVFEIARLQTVFKIAADVDAAVAL
jgi:anti-sigma B factor antagonist